MAGELSSRLEGKITFYDLENRCLEGKLFRVQHELNSYRDDHVVSVSEANRDLKTEVEELRPLKEKLQKAHNEVAALKAKGQRLPEAEKEAEEQRNRAGAAEEREQKLNAELQALKEVKKRNKEKISQAAVAGFQGCLNIVVLLGADIKFKYLDGTYEAIEGKIWKDGKVAFDPEEPQESPAAVAEEDNKENPTAQSGDAV